MGLGICTSIVRLAAGLLRQLVTRRYGLGHDGCKTALSNATAKESEPIISNELNTSIRGMKVLGRK